MEKTKISTCIHEGVEKRAYGGSHSWKPCVGKPLVKARLEY
ncbi:hypothetical protein ES332_A13G118300v1 [Gossypium tomentosum]|uniref:Uncharacterized protein n=1 Tax=Gossypium tomentosum TaxID=34277 RepID=A0A5D2MJA0_GOSTO|nr:hypothetical protein ES332_A13G118300v1 [Gossypium tomentosum]